MKSLVQTVVVDYQEQWSLISFERKNAKERNRQCKDEERKGENYLGYAKIVAKWQVLNPNRVYGPKLRKRHSKKNVKSHLLFLGLNSFFSRNN